jgi:hypothetical protein
MKKEYNIVSYEYHRTNVDYVKSDVCPGCVEAVEGWEAVEGSYVSHKTFATQEEAIAELERAYDPELEDDGNLVREYEVEEITYDDDGDVYDVATIAVRYFDNGNICTKITEEE